MPKGVYNRLKAKLKAKDAKDATATEPIAAMSTKVALSGFKTQATAWNKAGVCMVASATVCLLVGSYSKQKVDYDTTLIRLKGEVAETGIKEAQIYKYVGLAKALAGRLLTLAPDLVAKVVGNKMHDPAMLAIVYWLEKQQVTTLDTLGAMLGKYQRTPETMTTAAPEASPATVPANGTGPIETIAPTKAEPAAILARISREPEILMGLPAEAVVSNYIKSGHNPEELLEALIPYLSSVRVCRKVINRLEKRAEALREKADA